MAGLVPSGLWQKWLGRHGDLPDWVASLVAHVGQLTDDMDPGAHAEASLSAYRAGGRGLSDVYLILAVFQTLTGRYFISFAPHLHAACAICALDIDPEDV